MSKQSTVEWLVSILNKEGFAPVLTDEEIQQALQMEREQIEDAWRECMSRSAKEYYEKTYGGKDETI